MMGKDWLRYNKPFVVEVALLLALLLALFVYSGVRKNIRYSRWEEEIRLEEEERSPRREKGESIYEVLQASVKNSVPGIVCLGDESMAGGFYGSLTQCLKEIITDKLFVDMSRDFYRHANLYNTINGLFPVVNMAVIGESRAEIMVRYGAGQIRLAEDFTISSKTDPTPISLADERGKLLYFSRQRYVRFGQAQILGIVGHLYLSDVAYDGVHYQLSFGRSRGGESLVVPKGSPVLIEGAQANQDYVPVIWMAFDPENASGYIQDIKDILASRQSNPDLYAVVCQIGEEEEKDGTMPEAMKVEFGNHLIVLEQSQEELKKSDIRKLALRVYECLRQQGCFDEAAKAVDTARDALKAI